MRQRQQQVRQLPIDMSLVRDYFDVQVAVDPAALVAVDRRLTSEQLIPALARRNLKHLLLVIAARTEAAVEEGSTCLSLVHSLLALPPREIDWILTLPETASWIRYAEDHPWEPLTTLLPFLSMSVMAGAVRAGGDVMPSPLATTSPDTLQFRPLGVRLAERPVLPPTVVATVDKGVMTVEWDGHEVVVWDGRPGPATTPLPAVAGMVVTTAPDSWLAKALPGYEDLLDPSMDPLLESVTRDLGEATSLIDDLWPEMLDDLKVVVQWLVPLAIADSYFVPGFRGLVALDQGTPAHQARTIVHEGTHNKLSSVLELFDLTSNPADLCVHPFSRDMGPVTSLLQSCWAFTHELQMVRKLRAAGWAEGLDRVERKATVFLRNAFPALRAAAQLTDAGNIVVTKLESEAGVE